QSGRH
ncbi:hypothetical protein ECNE037_5877, partial [Escherichia coli NE037]